jgi:hypothetical protein
LKALTWCYSLLLTCSFDFPFCVGPLPITWVIYSIGFSADSFSISPKGYPNDIGKLVPGLAAGIKDFVIAVGDTVAALTVARNDTGKRQEWRKLSLDLVEKIRRFFLSGSWLDTHWTRRERDRANRSA